MSLVISKETLEKIEMSEEQLRIEIAVMLFQQERFTLAQAARFAQINQLAFQRLLASRRIPLHYGMEELMEDFDSLKDSVRPSPINHLVNSPFPQQLNFENPHRSGCLNK